ncbi:uncharacterized protein LOC129776058 [Toxorhynchites rutilus septentrionalis]|uniref:uncharacterized protein LOC129776058 n=1 Tax=Toxorhynchites rutilus septentrionalis TaxID=329112 RepID=UPI002478F192|nr:uncharacterized protein LOC129776058 [Toxorhynchites rutilus septentrionalis]
MAVWFRPWFLLLVVATVVALVCLSTGADGFRLRDTEVDEDERVSIAVSKRKIQQRRAAMVEVVKKRAIVDDNVDDEDDDDDGDEDDKRAADNDDEDEEEERAAESKYKFERVHRSYRLSPAQKKKAEGAKFRVEDVPTKKYRFDKMEPKPVDDDDDDEDDEDDDDDGEEEQERSISNLFGLFGSKKLKEKSAKDEKSTDVEENGDDDDNEEDEKSIGGMFAWLAKLKDTVSDKDKEDYQKEDDDDDNDDEESGGIFGWLKKLTEKDDDDQDGGDNGDDDDGDDEEDAKQQDKIKDNPLITLVSSFLSSNQEDTSEEDIKLRPVGSEDDDEDEESELKKSKDSAIVTLFNKSPLISLFKPEDLPVETLIETDPKRVKKLKQTPSKVVKQRIEISPEDFESLLLRIPSFVPDYSRLKNGECRRQGQIFQRQLRGKRLWALQMIDASAKVTSGLLRGNANQLGDFDLCTGIATKVKVKDDELVRMRGKYCLAHIDVIAEDENLRLPVHLLQGRGFIKSTLNDPDHFLPRFTTINWGICLPAACSYEDAGSIVEHFVKPYNTTGIRLFLEIEEGNCHVRQTAGWTKLFNENWQLVAALGFYTFVLVVTVVASLNDIGIIKIDPQPKSATANENRNESNSQPGEDTNLLHQILMSFSLKRTVRQLVGGEDETLAGKDVIGCLSGLRALAMMVMFCALRLIPMGFQPYTNRNEFTESFNAPWSVVLRVAMLYADVYLVISGFLVAYHMVGEFKQKQKVAWFRRIVGRYLRLTLPLIPVLIFYSWIWEHLGNGPQWGDVVVKNANLCKHNFWNNVFFIQNWYPIEEGCAPHTFQLAIEMQLAIIAPFLLIILTKNPFYGVAAYVTLNGISTAMRFVSTTEDRLSPYVYHGIRLTQIYRTVNLSFSETLHRATPYLAGFGLGYMLRETDFRRHDRGINLSGWIGMAIAFGWCFIFPLDIGEKDFQFQIGDAAQYSALAPLSFALAICWVIYFCVTNGDSLLNRLLSCKPMIFLSKISYSVSLIQFLVFFYFAGTTRGSEVFSFAGYLNRAEVCLLVSGATILTLLYDLPIQNIKTILDRSGVFDRMEKKQSAKENEVVSNGTPAVIENGTTPGQQQEEAAKPEDDFVSPFDDRDEDDFGPRQIWKRSTPEPETKPASTTRVSWVDDVKESDPPKTTAPAKDMIEEDEEEQEIEEIEEEEENEEEEDEEEEDDEEKEVIRRPERTKSASPAPVVIAKADSPSPPPRRRQWRTWDIHDD